MVDVTYYVAMPFRQDDDGSPVAGAAEECQTSTTALRRAEILSRAAGSIHTQLRRGDTHAGHAFVADDCDRLPVEQEPHAFVAAILHFAT
jgi:ABC-type uncharacterized transport system substrate-binding protein